MNNASIELVRALYAAFAAGDVEAVLGALDPEVRWEEAEGFPYSDGNPYRGPRAVAEGVFGRLAQEWSAFRVEVRELAGGPELVLMLGRYRGRHLASGRELDAQVGHLWWLREGRVVRFQQLVDTAAVARARGSLA